MLPPEHNPPKHAVEADDGPEQTVAFETMEIIPGDKAICLKENREEISDYRQLVQTECEPTVGIYLGKTRSLSIGAKR